MTAESRIQAEIRIALSETCVCFRINVGCFMLADGRRIATGVPVGFSDLFGFRRSDGKAFFIEVKTRTGRTSPAQERFLAAMRAAGALAGVARSVEQALIIISG